MKVLINDDIIMTGAISSDAKNLYMRLLVKAHLNVDLFYSIKGIAKELCMSESTTKRYLTELRKYGLIRIYNKGFHSVNNYVVIPSEWVDFETIYTDEDIYIKSEKEFMELQTKVRTYYEVEATTISTTKGVLVVENIDIDKAKSTNQPKESSKPIDTLKVKLEAVEQKIKAGKQLVGNDYLVLLASEMRNRGLQCSTSTVGLRSALKERFKDADTDVAVALIRTYVQEYEKFAPNLQYYPVPTVKGILETDIFNRLLHYQAKIESRVEYDVTNHSNRVIIKEGDEVF